MGKWAEVHCGCPNRVPLPGSDFYFDEPHRSKHRLTKKEKAEVEEWERTTKSMFECGHRSGLIIELCPGDIIELYRDDLGSRLDLERRLDEVAEKMLSGPVIQMRRNVQQLKRPEMESTVGKIIEALTDAAKLCRASIEIRNPIRLLW